MSREDEIREWLDQIPAMGFDPTDAVEYVRELLDENARLRSRCNDLEERIGRTADGVCFIDATEAYCPHCGEKIDTQGGDSFTAYCWNCTNPDDGCWPHRSPRPMSWDDTLAKPKEPTQ